MFTMIWLAWGATYLLPQGEYERVPSSFDESREVVVQGSYHAVDEKVRLPWTTPFTVIFEGFEHGGNVIFFIFIAGGMFAVLRATGAIDALLGWLIERLGQRPAWLIGGGLFVFALGSSTIGMAEEYIPFVPVLVILCLALGFDTVTAIGILCVGYGTGYGIAAFNPFTVLIAQNIAGLESTSGLWFRLLIAVPFLAVAFHHVWSYASKIRADPEKSLVHGLPVPVQVPEKHPSLTGRHIFVFATLAVAIGFMVVAIKLWGWYMIELGGMFFGLTLLLALVGRLSADQTAKEFCKGAGELTTTALLVAFAYSISIVLEHGQVIDTVIHGVAGPLSRFPAHVAAVGMYAVQSGLNFFVPSGSGQAYLTMPIMSPLAEQVNVSQQTAVLAYQMGDGFTNIVVPTNPVLIGILTMAGIPYDRWLKFIFPFILKMFLLGSLTLILAVAIKL
jgi:uncharacterized ion transporter superfamily protein YfcC